MQPEKLYEGDVEAKYFEGISGYLTANIYVVDEIFIEHFELIRWNHKDRKPLEIL